MLKHYVEIDEPGILLPESSTREVASRIPAELKDIPQYCYALNYYSREEIPAGRMLCEKDLEFIPSEIGIRPDVCFACDNRFKCASERPQGAVIFGKPKNKSPRILFGTKYTLAQVKAMGEDRLYRNLENYDSKIGVKCIAGNWQPLQKGDIVLASHADLKTMTKEW